MDRLLRSENMCPGDGVEESPCAVHHALARPVEVRFGEGFRGPQWGDGRSVKTILYPEKKKQVIILRAKIMKNPGDLGERLMLFIVLSGFLDTSWWLIFHAKCVDDWMILSQVIGPSIATHCHQRLGETDTL